MVISSLFPPCLRVSVVQLVFFFYSTNSTATGRATGGGKSVCFCEAEITDANGTVTAKAMGTFRYRAPGPSKAGE